MRIGITCSIVQSTTGPEMRALTMAAPATTPASASTTRRNEPGSAPTAASSPCSRRRWRPASSRVEITATKATTIKDCCITRKGSIWPSIDSTMSSTSWSVVCTRSTASIGGSAVRTAVASSSSVTPSAGRSTTKAAGRSP